jgi:two-component system chemotaxis sensor kinase CheA
MTALAVRVDDVTCLVPRDSLVEVVRVPAEERPRAIEAVGDAHVLWLRGHLVSLLFVRSLLGLGQRAGSDTTAGGDDLSVVIVQAEGRRLALAVDEILDSEELELQALPDGFAGLELYQGAGVLDSGGVGLVLDVSYLSTRAGILDEQLAGGEEELSPSEEGAAAGERRRLVLLRAGSDRRMAVPLERVCRLETVATSTLERSGQATVMQYRGGLMPIHDLAAALSDDAALDSVQPEEISIVVIEVEGRRVGFSVQQILDVVEADLSPSEDVARQPGLSGAVVIDERVTDLVDVDQVARQLGYGSSAGDGTQPRSEEQPAAAAVAVED